jgi:hypothetical protein
VTVSALAAMRGVASQLLDAFAIIDNIAGKKEGDLARSTLDKVLAVKNQ